MSRYTITVTGNHRADPDAFIGYDPPLRTFFLQAFPDESGDDLALWLGTTDREYETLDALHAAVLARGYDFMPLPDDVAVRLVADLAAEATGRRITARSPRCCGIRSRSSPIDQEGPRRIPSGAGPFFCPPEAPRSTLIPCRRRHNSRDAVSSVRGQVPPAVASSTFS